MVSQCRCNLSSFTWLYWQCVLSVVFHFGFCWSVSLIPRLSLSGESLGTRLLTYHKRPYQQLFFFCTSTQAPESQPFGKLKLNACFRGGGGGGGVCWLSLRVLHSRPTSKLSFDQLQDSVEYMNNHWITSPSNACPTSSTLHAKHTQA